MTTTPMDFDTANDLNVSTILMGVTSTITVRCPLSTPYRIDTDKGLHAVSTVDEQRYMKTGTAPFGVRNTLFHTLSKTTSVLETDWWGDNGATFCRTQCASTPTGKTGIGTGVGEIYTVYGTFMANGTVAGRYSDIVTVTVNY